MTFIGWLAFCGLHVLGHLPGLGRSTRAVRLERAAGGLVTDGDSRLQSGAAGRWIVLCGAVLAGAILAVALIPHFSLWTAPGAFPHHGEH